MIYSGNVHVVVKRNSTRTEIPLEKEWHGKKPSINFGDDKTASFFSDNHVYIRVDDDKIVLLHSKTKKKETLYLLLLA